MAFLFKGGEQLYNEAVDLVNRKDFGGAKKKFQDAIGKGYSADGMAQAYIAIIDVGSNRGNTSGYRSLIDTLGKLSAQSMKFGLTEFAVTDLITECELDVKEIEAAGMSESDYMAKGNAIIAVAGEYAARIGEKNLIIDEIFKGNTVATGNREALILQAEAYSIMGKGCVSADPKTASEYMQMAYNFRKQIGDSGNEEMELSRNFARSATCWICGRPANGEGIHFLSIPAKIEPVFQTMTTGDVVKPISEDAKRIYICMPCYTSISYRSDEISKQYYEQAMNEMRAMEARLQSEISNLRFSVSMRR